LDTYFKNVSLVTLASQLSEIFREDYPQLNNNKVRVTNNLSLTISLINLEPKTGFKFADNIKSIINIVSNQIESLRKNAAIVLAKLAKVDTSIYNQIKENHGIDVLMNIHKFIK